MKIDRTTLLLADGTTADQQIEEGFFLIPPVEEGVVEPDAAILNWLRSNKVVYVRHESEGEIGSIAVIHSPINGAVLDGDFVVIQGRAGGDAVTGWSLAYAPGPAPQDEEFTFIAGATGQGIRGQLERWSIRGLEPGVYVLRLTAENDLFGETVADVHVRIAGTTGRESDEEGEADAAESESGDEPNVGRAGNGKPRSGVHRSRRRLRRTSLSRELDQGCNA